MPIFGYNGSTSTTLGLGGSSGQAGLYGRSFTLPQKGKITKMAFKGALCGSNTYLCIYNVDGSSNPNGQALLTSGSSFTDIGGGVLETPVTNVVLNPGDYFLGMFFGSEQSGGQTEMQGISTDTLSKIATFNPTHEAPNNPLSDLISIISWSTFGGVYKPYLYATYQLLPDVSPVLAVGKGNLGE